MVTIKDYPKTEVEACLSVLVELMTVLGEYRESIALVGGWIPYFLFEKTEQEKHIELKKYKTLEQERPEDVI